MTIWCIFFYKRRTAKVTYVTNDIVLQIMLCLSLQISTARIIERWNEVNEKLNSQDLGNKVQWKVLWNKLKTRAPKICSIIYRSPVILSSKQEKIIKLSLRLTKDTVFVSLVLSAWTLLDQKYRKVSQTVGTCAKFSYIAVWS